MGVTLHRSPENAFENHRVELEQLRGFRARGNIIARLVLAVTTITEFHAADSTVVVESAGRYE
jgi:hypothetical protein